jgi:DNA-binding NarL/FixJ family response regulator
LAAGANGYVWKQGDPEELIRAIRTVLNGRTYLSAGIG